MSKNKNKTENTNATDCLFWFYSKNYRTYNVEVARALGSVNAAIVLAEIASAFDDFKEQGLLISKDNSDWIYYTKEKLEERTSLSREEQDRAIRTLESHKLIKKTIMGLPSKRYFSFNHKEMGRFQNEIPKEYTKRQTKKMNDRLCETHNLGCVKHTTCDVLNTQPVPQENSCRHNAFTNNINEQHTVCSSPSASPENGGGSASPQGACAPQPQDQKAPVVEVVEKKNFMGETVTLSKQEIFEYATLNRKNWTATEIEDAWEYFSKTTAIINSPIGFINGTIDNHRKTKQVSEINRKKANPKKKKRLEITRGQPIEPQIEKEATVENESEARKFFIGK